MTLRTPLEEVETREHLALLLQSAEDDVGSLLYRLQQRERDFRRIIIAVALQYGQRNGGTAVLNLEDVLFLENDWTITDEPNLVEYGRRITVTRNAR